MFFDGIYVIPRLSDEEIERCCKALIAYYNGIMFIENNSPNLDGTCTSNNCNGLVEYRVANYFYGQYRYRPVPECNICYRTYCCAVGAPHELPKSFITIIDSFERALLT